MKFPSSGTDPAVAVGHEQILMHVPAKSRAWLALGAHRRVLWTRDELCITTAAGERRVARPRTFRESIALLRAELDPQRPCHVLVSPDIARSASDPDIPLAVFVQPEQEHVLVHAAAEAVPAVSSGPPEDWDTEPDGVFLSRLERAVEALQGVDGKMIVTRRYSMSVPREADVARLFEIYSAMEPDAAMAHYFAAPYCGVSVGCSPENIFEVDQGRLIFDVVAATRGVHPDPVVDARWERELQQDPKELKEHDMALARYMKRLESCCEPGSVRADLLHAVRKLRNVRHLHSRLSGTLAAGTDAFDLLADSFPPLASYPPELIPLADPGREPVRYYGGMVGRIAPGFMTAEVYLNLRSVLVRDGMLHTLGGVGVIAESQPKLELVEVNNKLKCLRDAVHVWMSEARC